MTSAHRTHSNESLSRLSHELRTPLNAVIGFSRILERNVAGNQRPEDIELLRRIRAGGEQLLRVLESVMDQARRGDADAAYFQPIFDRSVESAKIR